MAGSFLDYYKTILEKVSFDQALLQKELNKALNTLEPNEATLLKNWVISRGLSPSNNSERYILTPENSSPVARQPVANPMTAKNGKQLKHHWDLR